MLLLPVKQAAFLEGLAKSLGVPEAKLQVAAMHMQSARAAESHLRIARHLSAQVRGTLLRLFLSSVCQQTPLLAWQHCHCPFGQHACIIATM